MQLQPIIYLQDFVVLLKGITEDGVGRGIFTDNYCIFFFEENENLNLTLVIWVQPD